MIECLSWECLISYLEFEAGHLKLVFPYPYRKFLQTLLLKTYKTEDSDMQFDFKALRNNNIFLKYLLDKLIETAHPR